MAGVKLPKVKTPAQMKAEMAVGRARSLQPAPPVDQTSEFRPTQAGDTVGGYMVREDIPDKSSIGASLENYKTLGLREVPMSAFSVRGKPEYYSKQTREYTQNLAEQINQNKELNPLIVVKDKEGYYVLEGGHRFDALRELNAQSFPALVVEDLDGMARGGIVKMAKGGLKPVKAPKVSAPKVESPTVMKRSDVSDLFRLISEREGSYGAKRVERAADEIPNLEKLYTLDALRSAFSGDNARALMTMKPADFEKYAAPLLTNLSQQSNDNIANLKAIQNVGGFADVPFLLVNKELAGSTGLPWVTGHEGRHRNRAMDEAGVQSGLVQFLPRAELREPFPRKSQEQYIEAIRKEMELSGNKIKPEKYYLNETDEKSFQRPAIDLPDLYAEGGAVKMRDGGDPDREFIDRMREEFSVYNKPTYGNEIPGTPTIDQQRYELTRQGQREAEGRSRMNLKDIAALAYPSAGIDALKTIGKSIVALPAYGAVNAFDWLQTGKIDPARAKQRGQQIEDWIAPKTQEGGELLEEIAKVGPAITGSEMGFGMHPNLWVSGIGVTTPKQTAAGLRLGAERVAPFAKDVGSMASELYMSGKMPGMVAPNMYAVSPDGKSAKVLAPANEIGFYSPTEAAALNLQRKSGAGQAFLNDIMKGENVRSDEISAMGLDTFLKDKKNVTADEVRDYIAQNKIQLGEEVYRDKPNFINFLKNKGLSPDDAESMYYKAENRDPVADEYLNEYTSIKKPKFSSYSLPGGENYREIVLTLPSEVDKFSKRQTEIEQLLRNQNLTEEQKNVLRTEYKESADKIRGAYTYQSSHWDEPNPLAHLRVSDRVTDGKKTLLVDEVQSDWHQAGRELGYQRPINVGSMSADDILFEYRNELSESQKNWLNHYIKEWEEAEFDGNTKIMDRMTNYLSEWASKQKIGSIPDAPYKDDWYQLTLRRAIKEAIDGGYDRVALPTGSRVAERFDLSKQIDRIDYNKNDDGTYSMSAIKDGREVFAKEGLDEKELSGIVGKDVAKKIVGDEGSSAPKADRWESEDGDVPEFKSLSGLDLSVGGEGMKKYYDEIYPGYLKKFGKKYGANVGTTYVQTEPPTDKIFRDLGKFHAYTGRGSETKEFNTYAEALEFLGMGKEPLHYMDITPAMRKEFSTGIPMKHGGKVQFAKSLDAMRHELTKAK